MQYSIVYSIYIIIIYYLINIYLLFVSFVRSFVESLSRSAQHNEKRFVFMCIGVGRSKRMVHINCARPPRNSNSELTTLSKKFYISKFGNGVIL